MSLTHVQALQDAMRAGATDQLGGHFSDDVVLNSPFGPEPFTGKKAVLQVLSALLATVDEFDTTKVIADQHRVAAIIRIRAGDTEVGSVDWMTVDADGLVDSMTTQWRPLAAIVAIQQQLAPLMDTPALDLVEKKTP